MKLYIGHCGGWIENMYYFGVFTNEKNISESLFSGFAFRNHTRCIYRRVNNSQHTAVKIVECSVDDIPLRFKNYIQSNQLLLDLALDDGVSI